MELESPASPRPAAAPSPETAGRVRVNVSPRSAAAPSPGRSVPPPITPRAASPSPEDAASPAAPVIPSPAAPVPEEDAWTEWEGPPLFSDTSGIAPRIVQLPPDPREDIGMVRKGIKPAVKNIYFTADSDRILPSERPRLDTLAAELKQVPPDRMILVDGHTAAVGRPAVEMDLSFRRAQYLVEALKSRGIDGDRLVFRAWGATKPLGDNTTEAGRLLNRRAEITILNEGELP